MNYDPYSNHQVRFLRSDPTARIVPLNTPNEITLDIKRGLVLALVFILLLVI